MFKNKILLITGGTGSFGNAVCKRFLESDVKEIRIFSRDEKKQDDMRKLYNHEKLKFYIGDVRDKDSLNHAMDGVNFVFHAAALKQVPSCEFYPIEAVKTNILGAFNVLDIAIEKHVEKIICLSTDKAAYPINAMGISKAMMEKIAYSKARLIGDKGPTICLTRYGNVMASRGSVIPLFIKQIENGQSLTITDPTMTRFMMTLDEAVDLVVYTFMHGQQGDLFIRKAPAATITTLAKAILELKSANNPIKIIGTRHGEKVYEVLVTREEMVRATDMGQYYRIQLDTRDLNYDHFSIKGKQHPENTKEYTSHNTNRLNLEEMKELLLKLDLFKGG